MKWKGPLTWVIEYWLCDMVLSLKVEYKEEPLTNTNYTACFTQYIIITSLLVIREEELTTLRACFCQVSMITAYLLFKRHKHRIDEIIKEMCCIFSVCPLRWNASLLQDNLSTRIMNMSISRRNTVILFPFLSMNIFRYKRLNTSDVIKIWFYNFII